MEQSLSLPPVEHATGGEPNIIRLLDKDGRSLIDSVSASYEDSFSLDPFSDLIKTHNEKTPTGNLIIARVQTWDRKQPDKAFYSYYDAYHLNKILFQTQIYCGKKLIHRILVLNPLTNTDIIGDVQYFHVQTRFDPNLQTTPQIRLPETNSFERRKSTQERLSFFMRKALPPTLTIQTSDGQYTPVATPVTPQGGNEMKMTQLPGASRMTETKESMFLRSALLDPNAAPGPQPNMRGRIRSLPSAKIKKNEGLEIRPEAIAKQAQITDVEMGQVGAPPPAARRFSLMLPQPGQNANERLLTRRLSHMRSKTTSPAGRITQFNQPIPEDLVQEVAPPTPEMRRRNMSLSNTIALSPIKTNSRPTDEEAKTWAASVIKEEEINTTYDAVLIGTDTDYLESSKMRAYFRSNAREEGDTQLFEMPPFPAPNEDVELLFGDPDFDNRSCMYRMVCTPHPTVLQRMTPGARFFHSNKCYLFSFVLIATIFAMIIVFLQNDIQKSNTPRYGSITTPA